MTPQEENAAILLSHSRIRPEFIQHDGSTIASLVRLVESAEKGTPINHDALPMGAVKGETESHSPDGSRPFTAVRIASDCVFCDGRNWQHNKGCKIVGEFAPVLPADDAICQNCSHPYEEHAAHGHFCPNVWDEDSDWSSTKRFR